jgi:hypothetical protein
MKGWAPKLIIVAVIVIALGSLNLCLQRVMPP